MGGAPHLFVVSRILNTVNNVFCSYPMVPKIGQFVY